MQPSEETVTEYQNTLKEIYETALDRPNGEWWEHHGFTFWKVEMGKFASLNHSEVVVLNPEGERVESYTVEAFDSFDDFAETVHELIEYDPDDLSDWLNRDDE